MTRWRMVWFECPSCSTREERLADMDQTVCPEVKCPLCDTSLVWLDIPGTPLVLNASHPDGYRRGSDWQRLKEASKLETASYDLPPAARGELAKEVKKLRRIK